MKKIHGNTGKIKTDESKKRMSVIMKTKDVSHLHSENAIAKRVKSVKEKGIFKGKNNPNYKGGDIIGLCEECGNQHSWKRYAYRNAKHHFCSNDCKTTFYQRNYTGENHLSFKGVSYCCDYCGKKCLSSQSEYSKYEFHFCSRECDNNHRKEQGRFSGENNPAWKGGLSCLPYAIEWTTKLKRDIRNRDNNTCQICGELGKEVHHINYNKQDCSKDNLITLCQSCHSKTNFHREKWIEFFNEVKL